MDTSRPIATRIPEQHGLGKYSWRRCASHALGAALWFASIAAFADYTVTPFAGANGSMSPATPQTVVPGATTSFVVTPNPGFAAFTYGTCGGSLTGSTFTTSAINNNCTVGVQFPAGYTVSPSAGPNGSISPAAPLNIGKGTTTDFTIAPNVGYVANIGGTCGGALVGNVYRIKPGNTGCSVDATFVANPLTVTVTAGANGSFFPLTAQQVAPGTSASVVIAPASGYAPVIAGSCPSGFLAGSVYSTGPVTSACNISVAFTQNAHTVTPSAGPNGTIDPITPGMLADGNVATFVLTPVTPNYHPTMTGTCGGSLLGNVYTTHAINANCTVAADFQLNSFAVTPSTSGNGSISPNTVVTTNYGSTATFTLSPSAGYFTVMGGTCGGALTGNTYNTNLVTDDCTVTATFTNVAFTVTPSAGTNGSISPSTSQNIAQGAKASFTIIPDSGYKATLGGTCGGSFSSQYIFNTNTINSDCTVSATFALKTYTVTPSTAPNGTISPNTGVTVTHGSTTTFTITPSQGFTAAVGGTCGGSLTGNTYTTSGITGPCTVVATFTQVTFVVTPSAGTNGSISPSTPQTIAQGATTSFSVTPNTGYVPSVGGTCGGSLNGPVYTTNPISAVCTVAATFAAVPPIALLSVASRMGHGALGNFDLPITTGVAINGSISVEPRIFYSSGRVLVFHFDSAVTNPGTVTAVNANGIAIGSATAAASGNDVLVTLNGIPDNRRVLVTLNNVNGIQNVSAAVGYLVADANASRAVDSSDVAAIKSRAGQTVTPANFRFDINHSGLISAADIAAAKARSGAVLP